MKAVVLVLLVVAAAFAMATAYFLLTPRESRLAPFSDAEYLARAERTDEAQALLGKYPGATRSLERDPAVVAEFRAERAGHALRLRILLDAFANRPLDSSVQCDSGAPRTDVLDYLRSETCLGN